MFYLSNGAAVETPEAESLRLRNPSLLKQATTYSDHAADKTEGRSTLRPYGNRVD